MSKDGVRPNKALGQNFLINDGVCEKIANAAVVDACGAVIEIGPGLGALTRKLAERAKKVVVVEIDSSIIPKLKENLKDYDNIEIINADILTTDLNALIEERCGGMRISIAGNLPYYITSPIIMALLERRVPAERITAMVQKEAAARLCAADGSREGGAISLAVRYYSEPSVLFDVSPGSFYPAPKVTSSVIRLDVLDMPRVAPKDEKFMFRIIKAAFCMRRKTAVNAISSSLALEKAKVADAVVAATGDPNIRPERINLSQYVKISDLLL